MSWDNTTPNSFCYCDYCKVKGYNVLTIDNPNFVGWYYIPLNVYAFTFNHICPTCQSELPKVKNDIDISASPNRR